MSITREDFEAAKTNWQSLNPQIQEIRGQLKVLTKQQRGLKKLIHEYMVENELEEVDVGGMTFKIETKTRFKVSQDDLTALIEDEDILDAYKVTEDKLSVKRKRGNAN